MAAKKVADKAKKAVKTVKAVTPRVRGKKKTEEGMSLGAQMGGQNVSSHARFVSKTHLDSNTGRTVTDSSLIISKNPYA